jgi:nicotinamide-nucleotide amidase
MNLFNDSDLAAIREHLLVQQESIAVAESVTAGCLQLALASPPDASLFFQGGLTAYNLGQKCRQLNIDPIHAQAFNSVSLRIAEEMAIRVTELFNSSWGIGITGYATPVPESENGLYAYAAISYKRKIRFGEKIVPPEKDPLLIQLWYVNFMIKSLASIMHS